MEYRTKRYCIFLLHVHLVFVTKYRKSVFTLQHYAFMKTVFEKVCSDFHHDIVLKEVNGEQNHVHLLIEYPPMVEISKLVNSLKGVSSRLLKKQYPELEKKYYKGALWSPSYFAASCGGAPLEILKQYIQNQ
jgi:putative transposase